MTRFAGVDMPDTPTEGFSDWSALQQLARALWGQESVRGAAVMVGSGLSKNAELPGNDTLAPPLWPDLSKRLTSRLYPANPNAAPTNPLRLAEEYRKFFGQAGLDDFIRSNVPDRRWLPGALHGALLELPWTDVLTTNWDTLLERATEELVEPSYSVVRAEIDLTYTKSPRIIKLHGSIGDKCPLIFTEEDYRTYPAKHAAFVNLARQIFIENELVLIGFSGDDPNFLHWAGWVRDHLGGSARRIYLAGNLNLQPAARKYLESINIAPIDLAPIVSAHPPSKQHAEATRYFFDALKKAKPREPNEWQKTPHKVYPMNALDMDGHQRAWKDAAFAADLLKRTIPLLKADRANYPEWVVCPVMQRRLLRLDAPLFKKPVFQILTPEDRATALYEAAWHNKTAYLPLGQQLAELIADVLHEHSAKVDQDIRLQLAVTLAGEARLTCDDDGLKRWADLILSEASDGASCWQEAHYQLCLRARDTMSLDDLSAGLLNITSNDPIWKLRRAALHTEIGEYQKATDLIKGSAADLERRLRLDRNSLWIKSRLAWANWMYRASQAWSQSDKIKKWEFKELDVDPVAEIDYFKDRALENLKRRREESVKVRPAFEAGLYREGKENPLFEPDNEGLILAYQFDAFTASIGLPVCINHVNLSADPALVISDASHQQTVEWYLGYLRAVHSHHDKSFDRFFGRVAVAQLDDAVAATLASKIEKAIAFWNGRLKASQSGELQADRSRAIDVLRLLLSALARLSVRLQQSDAARVLDVALSVAKDPSLRYPWLVEAAGELALNALKSIPINEQGNFAFKIIEFPLSTEGGMDARFWPSLIPAIWKSSPVRQPDDARWATEVSRLISAAETNQIARPEAVFRLIYLSKRDALKPEEQKNFARALWAGTGEGPNALPKDVDLLDSVYSDLPVPDGIDVQSRLSALFSADVSELMQPPVQLDTRVIAQKQNRLASLANLGPTGIKPAPAQAPILFDQITSWQPTVPGETDPMGASFIKAFNREIAKLAGDMLALTIMPAMPEKAICETRAEALLKFIERVQSWEALSALPAFLVKAPNTAVAIVTALRAGLSSAQSPHARNAAVAVSRWVTAKIPDSPVPRTLIEQILFNVEFGQQAGLPAMLETAVTLLTMSLLEDGDIERLQEALKFLRTVYNYRAVEWESQKAVLVSLVRAGCVRLASALSERGFDSEVVQIWLDGASRDPLPEVRFALIDAAYATVR